MNAGDYFESGYRGTIRVEIKDGQIDKFEEDVNGRGNVAEMTLDEIRKLDA